MSMLWLAVMLVLTIIGALIVTRIEDISVQAKVRGALGRALGARAVDIRVRCRGRGVTLYGIAGSGCSSVQALDAAFAVDGVTAVHDSP